MAKDFDIDILILDYVHGVLTKEQEAELIAWAASSIENQEYFTQTIAYLELSSSIQTNKKYRAEKGWRKLSKKVGPKQGLKVFLREFGKIAAVFVVAFGLGYLAFQLNRKDASGNLMADYIVTEVPYGSRSVVTLPDGSRVWINAGSSIKYPVDFKENTRTVSLEGEAFFDIVTNAKKPFYVKASGLEVKATGTLFNVRAYADEEFIETTLVEGIVSVNRAETSHEEELVLKPNQKLTIYKDLTCSQSPATGDEKKKANEPQFSTDHFRIKKVEIKSDVKTDIYTSWKDEEWVIYKENFLQLAKKLEKRYDVKIQIKDLAVNEFSYSGTLKDENLKEVLEVLSITSPIKYILDNKNVTIWYNYHFNEN